MSRRRGVTCIGRRVSSHEAALAARVSSGRGASRRVQSVRHAQKGGQENTHRKRKNTRTRFGELEESLRSRPRRPMRCREGAPG